MTGSFDAGKLECPECGEDAGLEKRLKKNHRRWWAMVPSCLVLSFFLVATSYATHIWFEWRKEQNAAAAIKNLHGEVEWRSKAPVALRKWLPQFSLAYFTRVAVVNWRELIRLSPGPVRHKVTDSDLAHLRELSHLRGLYLSGAKVSDAGLVILQDHKDLEILVLVNGEVTDDGLANLKGLSKLKVLALVGTQVTDAGLVHLEGLTEMLELHLADTKLTDAGIAELQKALPELNINRKPTPSR